MKIVSFNINSIRARPHQIEHLRDTIDPDVIGLQETKVDDPEFPIEVINELGYHAEFWGQKGHYGVAILSKEKPVNTVKGFINDSGCFKRFKAILLADLGPIPGRRESNEIKLSISELFIYLLLYHYFYH